MTIVLVTFCASTLCTLAQDSWKATTQNSGDNVTNPSRVTESHSKSGNRTLDTRKVEVLGPDGQYQPYISAETETIQENPTTTHSVLRTYNLAPNGERTLVQQKNEEVHTSPSGALNVVRSISNPDLNGGLRMVQREVTQITKTGPDSQESKSTLFFPDGSGNMAPASQSQELQNRSSDGTIRVKKTTSLPDGNGAWKPAQLTETTINKDGKNETREDRVSISDTEGRLSPFSRNVTKQTEANGQTSSTVETYSLDAPGVARDGNLHLAKRTTTTQQNSSAGSTTHKQVEQPDPGNPSDGLQLTTKTINIVSSGPSGTREISTVDARDPNGAFHQISIDTRKSDQVPTVQIAPPANPR